MIDALPEGAELPDGLIDACLDVAFPGLPQHPMTLEEARRRITKAVTIAYHAGFFDGQLADK